MKLGSVAVLTSFLVVASGCASGLPKFGATKDAESPYDGVVSYYGYIAPGSQPDETRQNKRMYYLYMWIPTNAPELGIRVVSPTKDLPKVEGGQTIQQPEYSGNADSTEFFDPWVLLERCTNITNPTDVGQTCGSWSRLGENDDSNELPDQPSGRKTNALFRVSSNVERGLYRIGLTDNKRGEVGGTYLLQVGAPVQMSGVAIARTADELRRSAR